VNDKSSDDGGKQHTMAFDGYTIPSGIWNRPLAYSMADNMTILERGVNDVDNYFVQDLPICKSAIQVCCNKTPIIVIMHQYTYFGKGRNIFPDLHIAIQIDDDSNGYPPPPSSMVIARTVMIFSVCSTLKSFVQSSLGLFYPIYL